MKVLSIDVGIKNLAFCLFEKIEPNTYNICKWNVVNIANSFTEPEEQAASLHPHCSTISSRKKTCNNKSKYEKNGIHYCTVHAKSQSNYLMPIPLNLKKMEKQKLAIIHETVVAHNIPLSTNVTKKSDIIDEIRSYISNNCLEPYTPREKTNNINKASIIDLITVGKNIKTHLDLLLKDDISDITDVLIENQISPIANRMKTVQGMLTQYFIMKSDKIHIQYISSINKLKILDKVSLDTITTYSGRKSAGVFYCIDLLSNSKSNISGDKGTKNSNNFLLWLDYFKSHKKKDDLADSFLQGLWYIYYSNHNTIQV